MISVIIPVFNSGKYAIEAAESVRSQLDENCELIIVDDGSEQETVSLLQQYAEELSAQSNVRIIFSEHAGASHARNEGLAVATGDYIAFLDGDDCMEAGFIERTSAMLDSKPDLCIFSIENYYQAETQADEYTKGEEWKLDGRTFADASEFADEYIRHHNLLLYSNCNKYYKREIITAHDIRFDEDVTFGEDRLFNYEYLMHCGKIVTSDITMLRYMHRDKASASTSYIPGYASKVLMLHRRKIECMEALSGGTDEQEKLAFRQYDIDKEFRQAIARLEAFPEEEQETVDVISSIVFRNYNREESLQHTLAQETDAMLVLGSGNCGYRAERAYELAHGNENMKYIVAGGNNHKSGLGTEAEYMKNILLDKGVPEDCIYVENRSRKTAENFIYSSEIITAIGAEKIGIVTAGFHIFRAEVLLKTIPFYDELTVEWFPAYGEHTRPDNWYKNTEGINLIMYEIKVMYDELIRQK